MKSVPRVDSKAERSEGLRILVIPPSPTSLTSCMPASHSVTGRVWTGLGVDRTKGGTGESPTRVRFHFCVSLPLFLLDPYDVSDPGRTVSGPRKRVVKILRSRNKGLTGGMGQTSVGTSLSRVSTVHVD